MDKIEYQREYYRMNKEEISRKAKEKYAKKNDDIINNIEDYYTKSNVRSKEYYYNNKDKVKAYQEKNKQKIKDKQHELYLKRKKMPGYQKDISDYISDCELDLDSE
jgi:hypothetical protein